MNDKPTGNSPGTALPVGGTAKIPIIPGYGPGPRIGDLTVSLLKVVRGEEIAASGQLKGIQVEPAPGGFKNVLFRLRVEYTSSGKGPRLQPYKMTEGQFLIYSALTGSEYPVKPFLSQPDEILFGHTFAPGESLQGWLICQAPEEESRPFLLFRRENVDNVWGLWSDTWFQLF